MGTMANIPAIVTEFSVLVIGIWDHSSSIAHHVDFDQLTQSVVYLQDTDIIYGRLLSAWERVQFISLTCSSRDHEAIGVDRKCRGWYPFIHIPWKTDNFFILLFDIIWLAPSWLSHFNRLGDLKQNSVPDSSDDQTSTDSKGLCVLLKGMSGRAKRLQKFMLRQQVNMNTITTKLTADDHNFSTAPTSLLQANLFLSTFVCLVTKPNT